MWNLDIDRRLFFSLVLGVFMGALDLTILAPALPHIGESFGVTPAAVVLAFSIYAAFYAAAVPLLGKLSDVRGYKPVYTVSMLLFSGGSALAALSPSIQVLVLARILQGIGGGGLFPVAQAMVGAALPRKQRGTMLGILLGAFALGGVMGPNLGGFLVQHLSWQWIFWINVPLGVIGAGLLVRVHLPAKQRRGEIDWVGAVLVALTLGSLVLGIEGLRNVADTGFFSLEVGGLFLLAVLGACVLVPVERRQAEPVLDVRLIASGTIAPLLGVSFLIGYALLGGMVFAPLYTQIMFGASAFGSGAILNAAALGLGLSSYIAGTQTNRLGARRLIIVGMACASAGLGLMILLQHSLWGLLVGLVFLGTGLGLSQGPISYLGLALTDDEDHGQISGLISITRSMGGAAGITLAGVLLDHTTRGLSARLPEGAELSAQVWGSSSSLQILRQASTATQEMVRQSLSAGLLDGWYVALGAALLGLALSFLLTRRETIEASQEAASELLR